MFISQISLKNWRNFQAVDNVPLDRRVFLVGPNASGKSNFLDVFRFLRDLAKSGGGLQQALEDRGGLTKIRCLAARQTPEIEIDVRFSNEPGGPEAWRYLLRIAQQTKTSKTPIIRAEQVWENGRQLMDRPDDMDKADPLRLTQTAMEQINANKGFRPIARFFQAITYMHLVPQLIRHPREYSGPGVAGDPFGREFLQRLAAMPDKTRSARLRKIERALKSMVPQFTQLKFIMDQKEGGIPHLEAVYEHWRPQGAKQREQDFSDGTLRMIGLLWSLMEGDSLMLMEEPELSLNSGVVVGLAELIHRFQKDRERQVIISTHSSDLLSSKGIGPEEVLMLIPDKEGTRVESASNHQEIRNLLDSDLSMAEAVMPYIRPNAQGLLFRTQ